MKRSGFKSPSKEKLEQIKLKKFEKVKAKLLKDKAVLAEYNALGGSKLAPKRSKAKKRPSVRTLKNKLWDEVKRITRKRWQHTCYTCGAQNLEGSNLHSGHGKPMGALPLRFKYDIRNIKPQCMVCFYY